MPQLFYKDRSAFVFLITKAVVRLLHATESLISLNVLGYLFCQMYKMCFASTKFIERESPKSNFYSYILYIIYFLYSLCVISYELLKKTFFF